MLNQIIRSSPAQSCFSLLSWSRKQTSSFVSDLGKAAMKTYKMLETVHGNEALSHVV
jgi:drug/metabolite transporter superfamily protein YnfA